MTATVLDGEGLASVGLEESGGLLTLHGLERAGGGSTTDAREGTLGDNRVDLNARGRTGGDLGGGGHGVGETRSEDTGGGHGDFSFFFFSNFLREKDGSKDERRERMRRIEVDGKKKRRAGSLFRRKEAGWEEG